MKRRVELRDCHDAGVSVTAKLKGQLCGLICGSMAMVVKGSGRLAKWFISGFNVVYTCGISLNHFCSGIDGAFVSIVCLFLTKSFNRWIGVVWYGRGFDLAVAE